MNEALHNLASVHSFHTLNTWPTPSNCFCSRSGVHFRFPDFNWKQYRRLKNAHAKLAELAGFCLVTVIHFCSDSTFLVWFFAGASKQWRQTEDVFLEFLHTGVTFPNPAPTIFISSKFYYFMLDEICTYLSFYLAAAFIRAAMALILFDYK